MVREYQHYTYKDNYSVVDLSGSPRLDKMAEAYDMKFIRVRTMENIDAVIDEILGSDERILVECFIDPMDLVK